MFTFSFISGDTDPREAINLLPSAHVVSDTISILLIMYPLRNLSKGALIVFLSFQRKPESALLYAGFHQHEVLSEFYKGPMDGNIMSYCLKLFTKTGFYSIAK